MERDCRYVPLSKQPLVLVLCQVKFSRVAQMERYADAIQETLRRKDFPIDRSGQAQQVQIRPQGVEATTQPRWEFRSRDERTSIILLQDSLVLQTTDYTRFEDFAGQLEMVIATVFQATELDRHGVVERIGLRYVDRVLAAPGRSPETYLRPGLHGIVGARFAEDSRRLHLQCLGRTDVVGDPGTMLVRITQGEPGVHLPADLVATAPAPRSAPEAVEVATLIDMDHFVAGSFDPDLGGILEKAYRLHDDLVETLHEEVLTPEAIEEWT